MQLNWYSHITYVHNQLKMTGFLNVFSEVLTNCKHFHYNYPVEAEEKKTNAKKCRETKTNNSFNYVRIAIWFRFSFLFVVFSLSRRAHEDMDECSTFSRSVKESENNSSSGAQPWIRTLIVDRLWIKRTFTYVIHTPSHLHAKTHLFFSPMHIFRLFEVNWLCLVHRSMKSKLARLPHVQDQCESHGFTWMCVREPKLAPCPLTMCTRSVCIATLKIDFHRNVNSFDFSFHYFHVVTKLVFHSYNCTRCKHMQRASNW